MLAFDIQVDIPDSIITEPASRAEHIVALQAMKDTKPYVPFLTGSLSNRTQVKQKHLRDETRVEGDTIIYPGPYARYLYYGKLMVDTQTGSAWARPKTKKKLTDKNLVLAHDGVDPQATSHWFEVSKAANIDKWVRISGKAMERERK